MKKVLLIGNFLSAKTASRAVIEDIADHLSAESVDCITASGIKNRYLRVFEMVLKAVFLRQTYQVAVVELYSGQAFLWAEILSKIFVMTKCPFAFVLHGGGLPKFFDQEPIRVKKCLTRAQILVAPSNYLYQKFKPHHGNIKVIPNGINTKKHVFIKEKKITGKLLWLRAFHEVYNPTLAIEVLSEVIKKYPEAKLTMVGPDKEDGSLLESKKLAEKLGVTDKVQFERGVPKAQVADVMGRSDVFLNTSNVDNSPVTIVEAMASGLGVVSTDVGGVRDWVEDQKEALLVPPCDKAAMAQAVMSLFEDPLKTQAIRQQARQKAEERDFSNISGAWSKLLEEIAGAGK